ncbi:MAG: PAS domain-containing protein [Elusimicrobia bacterium]|nr:PAS domain-containing protein [Elusimicrobiota bacterium]
MTRLLQALPNETGLGFVVIQHLDPKHESALPELLAKATRMPVLQVTDDMAVEPDHVYVVPPNFSMKIESGVLKLVPRQNTRIPPIPIDLFFSSLAKDQGDRAIGIILSGTGSDGSLGLKEIKEGGGVTFAQEEKTAKFTGMPHSAIATGAVGFILSTEGIGQELIKIAQRPHIPAPRSRKAQSPADEPGSRDPTSHILDLIRVAVSMDFTHYKKSTLARRISRRMALCKIDQVEKYVEHLKSTPDELQALSRDLLIKVTGFFRDPNTFEALKRIVIPSILKTHPADKPIRIWVPGCASGEEAYSIAICFLECMGERHSDASLQIFATDVDDAALKKDRAGLYPAKNCVADVSADRLHRFFSQVNGHYQINKMIRDMCTFAKHDLATDPPFSDMDLISCRNVLIYFEPVLKKRVLPIFHYALNLNGFLTLGASETIEAFAHLFNTEDKTNKIYTKKAVKTPALPDLGPLEARRKGVAGPQLEEFMKEPPRVDAYREAEQVLLNYLAPAGALINENREILQFRGQTERYLVQAPGRASLDILKMAREGLLGELKTAIDEAKKTGVPVERKDIHFRYNQKLLTLTLRVIPVRAIDPGTQQFIVLFEEPVQPGPPAKKGRRLNVSTERETMRLENAMLRKDLEATKQHMQSLIEGHETTDEDVKSANEELLAGNEELRSTNEELETAKEELQSSNEELSTVNDEVVRRNLELDHANSDLSNLFVSAKLPIIMLGSDLRIRRLTQIAEKLFNILPTDIGRPLADLKLNIQTPDLESLVASVISTANMRELELQDRQGTWYSLQIRPYMTVAGKVDGAVLLFIDLTSVKGTEKLQRSLDDAQIARKYFEGIVQTVREPLLILDAGFHVVSVNPAYSQSFKFSSAETEKQSFFKIGNGVWENPLLRNLLEGILPQNNVVHDYEVTCEFPNIGRRTMLLNGRRIALGGAGTEMILLAVEDVTDRRKIEEQLKKISSELEQKIAARTKELAAANKELESFCYSVAHDLRTPIRSIVSYSQLVLTKGTGLDEEVKAYLQRSISASRRMAALIDDLLELARLTRKEMGREPIDLSTDARAIADELKSEQPARRVEFKIADDLRAKGDAALVRIALRNLLDNAWKFTGQTAQAIIELGRILKDGKNIFFVRDNGAGFDMAYANKLFGVFQRLHDEKDFPGTGVGLVTVQQIVQRHGGKIWAEAEVNRGATFYFTLQKD